MAKGCPHGTVTDMCYKMAYDIWFYDSGAGRCTNKHIGGKEYSSPKVLCRDKIGYNLANC